MCDPITLGIMVASTAASVGGAGIAAGEAAKNNNRIAEARNKVLRDTNLRNMALGEKNRALLDARVAEMAPQNTAEALAAAQQERGDNLEAAISTTPTEVPLAGDAPQVIKSELGKKLAETFAKSKASARTLGNIGGYGAQMQDQAIADAGVTRGINTNNNFVGGNMRMLPYLQDYAEYGASKPSSGLGQILQSLGMMGSMYAGTRAPAPKSAPVPAPDFARLY